MRVVSILLALVMSLVMVGKLSAAEEKQRPEGRHSGGMPAVDQLDRVKGLNLTDDQKTKLADLKKEYGPKCEGARKKFEASLTEDQKKAQREAMKAARDAHKRGPDAWKAAQEAMKLTDDQKALQANVEALGKEVKEKVDSILTTEQKELLKKGMERRHGGGRPPKSE
jgi:Spy/CpxP family protein refolding chaperone